MYSAGGGVDVCQITDKNDDACPVLYYGKIRSGEQLAYSTRRSADYRNPETESLYNYILDNSEHLYVTCKDFGILILEETPYETIGSIHY